jgi:hypothetical protein
MMGVAYQSGLAGALNAIQADEERGGVGAMGFVLLLMRLETVQDEGDAVFGSVIGRVRRHTAVMDGS